MFTKVLFNTFIESNLDNNINNIKNAIFFQKTLQSYIPAILGFISFIILLFESVSKNKMPKIVDKITIEPDTKKVVEKVADEDKKG